MLQLVGVVACQVIGSMITVYVGESGSNALWYSLCRSAFTIWAIPCLIFDNIIQTCPYAVGVAEVVFLTASSNSRSISMINKFLRGILRVLSVFSLKEKHSADKLRGRKCPTCLCEEEKKTYFQVLSK